MIYDTSANWSTKTVYSADDVFVQQGAMVEFDVNQTVSSRHVVISEKGTRFFPLKIRYAWPSELDLMARLAGLRLRSRWGGWRGEPFTANSTVHVSAYEFE